MSRSKSNGALLPGWGAHGRSRQVDWARKFGLHQRIF
jgi:hypothetical protein